jgi:hypothetical protein
VQIAHGGDEADPLPAVAPARDPVMQIGNRSEGFHAPWSSNPQRAACPPGGGVPNQS